MKAPYCLFLTVLMLISCSKNTEAGIADPPIKDTIRKKDNTVLEYTKPKTPLVALARDQTVYGVEYSKKLRKIAEYYVDQSKRNLIQYHKNKPDEALGYSFEENDWEGVNYTQIGIFSKVGSNLSTLQWLFYEPKSQELYEFDLNTKKLQKFP